MYKVKNPFHDKYNPERIFFPGEYVNVEDDERVQDLIDKELIISTNDKVPKDIIKDLEMKNDMNVTEIKEKLDAAGIEYNPKAKKDELLKLLEGTE